MVGEKRGEAMFEKHAVLHALLHVGLQQGIPSVPIAGAEEEVVYFS